MRSRRRVTDSLASHTYCLLPLTSAAKVSALLRNKRTSAFVNLRLSLSLSSFLARSSDTSSLFPLIFACVVYGTERARDPIIRGRELSFQRVRGREHARNKKKTRDGGGRGGGRRGLQRRRELTLTRISLRQARARARCSVSGNPRLDSMRATCARLHCRRVICTEAQADGPGCLRACRYVSQPCRFLPPISSLTSF